MPVTEHTDAYWMTRCFDLAKRGVGNVSPNPPVGSVIVFQEKIIGEGFHAFYGGPHAEVNAIDSVKAADRALLTESTLYVSLEPCCVHGKTPPCTDLILKENIRHVVISTLDPNPDVAGKGMQLLQSKGINVRSGVLEHEGKELIKAFRVNILFHQPYIILKWAQSNYGYIGVPEKRIQISHPFTGTWTHTLRSMADVILVGARTISIDDPELTTRDAPGTSPHRAVYDPNGSLGLHHRLFNEDGKKVFYYSLRSNDQIEGSHIIKHLLSFGASHIKQMLHHLFTNGMGILMVEGGSYLLNLFINENLWHEAWVIKSNHPLDAGIKAPVLRGKVIQQISSATDTITGIENTNNVIEEN